MCTGEHQLYCRRVACIACERTCLDTLRRNRLVVEKVKKAEMPKRLQQAKSLSYLQRVTNMYIHYNPTKLLTAPLTATVITKRGRKVTAATTASGGGGGGAAGGKGGSFLQPTVSTSAAAASSAPRVSGVPAAATGNVEPKADSETFVQKLLRKCAGREEQLIARLVKQYGPEPAL